MSEVKLDHRVGSLKGTWLRLAKTLSRIEGRKVSSSAAKMRVYRKNTTAINQYEKQIKREVKKEADLKETINEALRIIGEVGKDSNIVRKLMGEVKK